MFRCLYRKANKTSEAVWPEGLKAKFEKLFDLSAIVDEHSGRRYLPVARLVSSMYEMDVLQRGTWPPARILEDMHLRGYSQDVFTKASYGAEPPAPLSLDECFKWIAHFRVASLNTKSR
jgi:hypothetical protein